MNIIQFFQVSHEKEFWYKKPIMLFQTPQPYLLFSQALAMCYQTICGHKRMVLDISVLSRDAFQITVNTSFLGQSQWYWIIGHESLDTATKKWFFTFLQSYAGPHTLGLFTDHDDFKSSNHTSIIVNQSLAQDEWYAFLQWLNLGIIPAYTTFTNNFYRRYRSMNLDVACMLASYIRMVGKDGLSLFTSQWLEHIIEPDYSLFSLSGYFFAQEQEAFFQYWALIHARYSDQFWISFWSEQLWRAHYVVHYQQANNQTFAKKIGYRLPFSFLQRDWQKYRKIDTLRKAHGWLKELDSHLKRGGTSYGLDVFYQRFFMS